MLMKGELLKTFIALTCILAMTEACSMHCPENYPQVCGFDGNTYQNECYLPVTADCSPIIAKKHDGPCQTPTTPSFGSCSGECKHTCKGSHGSCQTEAKWTTIGGTTKWAQGACFPKSFGGKCTG